MNQESFDQWQRQEQTQEFFKYLWRVRLMAMEDWAHRAFVGTTPDQTNRKNDHALGQVETLSNLLTIRYADIEAAYEATGGISEFRYPIGRENDDQQGVRVDASRPA